MSGMFAKGASKRPQGGVMVSQALSAPQVAGALLVFFSWVVLFGAGMLVDTRPYREKLSPTAVTDPGAAPTGKDQKGEPQRLGSVDSSMPSSVPPAESASPPAAAVS